MEGDLGQEAEMCWGSFTLAYQEGNTLPSNGCLADTETQVTQQPHQGGVGGQGGLTSVGPQVGLQVGRLGVDLLAACRQTEVLLEKGVSEQEQQPPAV